MKALSITLVLMLLFIVSERNRCFANEINIGANSRTVVKTYKEYRRTVNHIIISPINESLFVHSKSDVINHITNIIKKVNDGRIFETFDGGKNWYEISNQSVEDLSFGIYPNPAIDEITLNLSRSVNSYNIMISSVAGKGLIEQKQYDPILKMDVSHLPSGAYYITILTDDNKVIINRFVKK